MTTTMNNGQIEILRNAMLFSLTRHAWRNRAMVSQDKVEVEADKSRITTTAKLINNKELEALYAHMNEVYNWCLARAMLAGLRRGIYFVKRAMVTEFEAKIAQANKELAEKFVPAFLATYEASKAAAKLPADQGGLGELYVEKDFPKLDDLKASFWIEHSWMALSVPDELPEEIRQRENKKLKAAYQEAQVEIKYALREGLKGLIDKAVAALDENSTGSTGKKRVFKENSLDKFNEFFDTFEARNLLDDAELSQLVSKAKEIVKGLPPAERVRRNYSIRQEAADKFKELNVAATKLIVDRPQRKFSLDD